MARIDAFFRLMHSEGGSDLHLAAGAQPAIRKSGTLMRIDYPAFEEKDLRGMLYEICPEDKQVIFEECGDLDFAYEIPGVARFRANYFQQKDGISAVFRQIPSTVLTADQLMLPDICKKFAMLKKGLVLVTGPTGSGKSTTLAAMIDYANKNRRDHILTLEDPIEFVHRGRLCHVSHREIGVHTKDFHSALKGALREDPDIIMIGELRDLETIEMALEAAATGHLVFATLHTINAIQAIDRIIGVFPANQQETIRASTGDALKGVVAQNLFRRVDKGGRCAALEILVITNPARNAIRQGKIHLLTSVMQTGKSFGMQTLDDAIDDLLERGWISPEEAFDKSVNKKRFASKLREPPDDLDMF